MTNNELSLTTQAESAYGIEAISLAESRRLIALEAIVAKGLNTFVAVGEALLEIRDSRLYRIEHGTFEEYCKSKWGMSRMYASNLIRGAAVAANVNHGLQPTTERQARPLTRLEPEQQKVAWSKAVDAADGKQPTAKQVAAAVEEVKPPMKQAGAQVVEPSPEITDEEWEAIRKTSPALIASYGIVRDLGEFPIGDEYAADALSEIEEKLRALNESVSAAQLEKFNAEQESGK